MIILVSIVNFIDRPAYANCQEIFSQQAELFPQEQFPEFYHYGNPVLYRGFSWKVQSQRTLSDHINIDNPEYNSLSPQERVTAARNRLDRGGVLGFLVDQTWEHRGPVAERVGLSVSEDIAQVISLERYGETRFAPKNLSVRALAVVTPDPTADPAILLSRSPIPKGKWFPQNEGSLLGTLRLESLKFFAVIGDAYHPDFFEIMEPVLVKAQLTEVMPSLKKAEDLIAVFEIFEKLNWVRRTPELKVLNELSLWHYAFKSAWIRDLGYARDMEKIETTFNKLKTCLDSVRKLPRDRPVLAAFELVRLNFTQLLSYLEGKVAPGELQFLKSQISEILNLVQLP